MKLTPNRPDCTGVRGIARDLAAAGLGKLKPEKKITGVEGDYDCPVDIKLEFPNEARDACPVLRRPLHQRRQATAPSPAWMQQRLKAVGLRPINALVDVTNYISLDRGRPLHVYDADKLKGAIRARLGKKGEKFGGLDGKTHEVDETMCVIADDRAVLGFGGILGGEDTGCTHDTKNVLIECAYFDPLRTAATGRKAGVSERCALPLRARRRSGLHPAGPRSRHRHDAGGGRRQAVEGARLPAHRPKPRPSSTSPSARSRSSAGITLPREADPRARSRRSASRSRARARPSKVTVPSWRPDIHGAADLVEEVVRIAGLDKVPSAPMPRSAGVARAVLTETPAPRAPRAARAGGRGMVEAITWSFIPRATARSVRRRPGRARAGQPDLDARCRRCGRACCRACLPPCSATATAASPTWALFEVGQAYRGDAPEDQFIAASGVRAGAARAGRLRPPLGGAAPRRPTCSTPRPTWSRCWRLSASTPPRRR